MRPSQRQPDELRKITLEKPYTKYAAGSVLIAMGETKVICTASVENRVPPFLRDSGSGWVTAEYSMLPAATHTRIRREVSKGKPTGRTNEIQRLIGRALRSVVDLEKLGERSITIDCDVIQADGGTRTASITGGMIALSDAIQQLLRDGEISENPVKEWLAAISVGIVNGEPVLDLDYDEDSTADVDMNVVMTESKKLVEIQGTAEAAPFSKDQLQQMLSLAEDGIQTIINTIKTDVEAPAG